MNHLRKIGLVLATCFIALGFVYVYAGAQEIDQEQLELGARLYAENCAVCHGTDGEGRVGATLAKDWPSIRPDARIRTTIENGIEGSAMPAWSQENGGPLNVIEIDALVAYILSWETNAPRILPPTPTPVPRPVLTEVPGVEGDPNQGALLYDQNCLVCHGNNGEGRIGATLAKDWPSIRPDLSVRTTVAEGIEGSIMPAWSQANGGPLTEAEIDNVTAFLMVIPSSGQLEPTATPVPTLNTFLTGWGGVIIFLVLFALIIAIALLVQRRK
ncbi:MAG: c-type cytochrome [Anaerolineales bacterium]